VGSLAEPFADRLGWNRRWKTAELTIVVSCPRSPAWFVSGVDSRSDCPARLEIDVELEIATADCLLAETLPATLHVTAARATSFALQVRLAELNGAYGASEFAFGDHGAVELEISVRSRADQSRRDRRARSRRPRAHSGRRRPLVSAERNIGYAACGCSEHSPVERTDRSVTPRNSAGFQRG